MSQSERERALRDAGDMMFNALEHFRGIDMWQQYEGAYSGGPDGELPQDPLIWMGGDNPADIGGGEMARWKAMLAALDTPQEPTPAAPPAWDERDQSTISDFERWWMRESTSSPLGDALDQVDIHTQALIVAFCKSAWLAAAPRPALSPDAIERMVGKIGQRCVRGHDLFDGAACKEILIEAFRASAPREGA